MIVVFVSGGVFLKILRQIMQLDHMEILILKGDI